MASAYSVYPCSWGTGINNTDEMLTGYVKATMNFKGIDVERNEYFSICLFSKLCEKLGYCKIKVNHHLGTVKFLAHYGEHHVKKSPTAILKGGNTRHMDDLDMEICDKLEDISVKNLKPSGTLKGFCTVASDNSVRVDFSQFRDGKRGLIYHAGMTFAEASPATESAQQIGQYLSLLRSTPHKEPHLEIQLLVVYFQSCYHTAGYKEAVRRALESFIDIPVDNHYINMCHMVCGTNLNYKLTLLGKTTGSMIKLFLLDFDAPYANHKYYIIQVSTDIDELNIREYPSLEIIATASNIGSTERISKIFVPSAVIGSLKVKYNEIHDKYQVYGYDRLAGNSTVAHHEPKHKKNKQEFVEIIMLSKPWHRIGTLSKTKNKNQYKFEPIDNFLVSYPICRPKYEHGNAATVHIHSETCVLSILTVCKVLFLRTDVGKPTCDPIPDLDSLNNLLMAHSNYTCRITKDGWKKIIGESSYVKPLPNTPCMFEEYTPGSTPGLSEEHLPTSRPCLSEENLPSSRPGLPEENLPSSRPGLPEENLPASRPGLPEENLPSSRPGLSEENLPGNTQEDTAKPKTPEKKPSYSEILMKNM